MSRRWASVSTGHVLALRREERPGSAQRRIDVLPGTLTRAAHIGAAGRSRLLDTRGDAGGNTPLDREELVSRRGLQASVARDAPNAIR